CVCRYPWFALAACTTNLYSQYEALFIGTLWVRRACLLRSRLFWTESASHVLSPGNQRLLCVWPHLARSRTYRRSLLGTATDAKIVRTRRQMVALDILSLSVSLPFVKLVEPSSFWSPHLPSGPQCASALIAC